MKPRHSSREKQTLSKVKPIENNYQSARESENNSKLANLLNLSDHNINDLINRPNASFVPGINNKAGQGRKSAAMFGNSLSSCLINEGKENATIKLEGKSKTKRSKTSKKNILSCKQILNIVKKRDTFSMLSSFEPAKNSIFSHYGQTKAKKKIKKEGNSIKNLNPKQNLIKPEEHLSNFVANYPLSMSHSLIVFSEKDSSLNNTANVLGKLSSKLSKSSEGNLVQLQNRLELIKIEHAAIIIQKNWRGYLTRKLLSDYIVSEESRLVNRLSNLKAEREEYKRFERMSPGCNKVWSNLSNESSEISQIFQNQNNKAISISRSQSQSEEYPKKAPVLNGFYDQNQIFESILQLENSANVTSRVKNNQELIGNQNKERKSNHLQKSVNTQNSSRKMIRSSINFKINSQFNQVVSQGALDFKSQLNAFTSQIKCWMDDRIQNCKEELKNQVLKSGIQFDQMLIVRQKLKTLKSEFEGQLGSIFKPFEALQALLKELKGQKDENIPVNEASDLQVLTPKSLTKEIEPEMRGSNNNSSPISQYFTIELPTEQLSPFKQQLNSGLESLKTYLENLHEQCLQEPQDSSETSYLCKVLKKHAQIGPENMIERCLIQMLVEMLTGGYMLEDLLIAVQLLTGGKQIPLQLEDSPSLVFIRKWADELEKWQLGPIEEVSCNMEESADVTERKTKGKSQESQQFQN